jgi:hypothetical protein
VSVWKTQSPPQLDPGLLPGFLLRLGKEGNMTEKERRLPVSARLPGPLRDGSLLHLLLQQIAREVARLLEDSKLPLDATRGDGQKHAPSGDH